MSLLRFYTRARCQFAHIGTQTQRNRHSRTYVFHAKLYTIQIQKENISFLKKLIENSEKLLTR
nr:MAG TPA_asm: pHiosYI-coil, peptide design, de novo [Bacteriophage sp.]